MVFSATFNNVSVISWRWDATSVKIILAINVGFHMILIFISFQEV